MSEDFDYLFLEPLLIDRVKDQVEGLQEVCGIPDLQTLDQQQQLSPAVYVIYLGDVIGTGPGNQGGLKKVQKVQQQWAFVLALSSADATSLGEQARRTAGPLLGALISAVTGWAPAADVAPLFRVARQAPVSYHNNYFYYPIIFNASFVFPRIRTWQPAT